VQAATRGRRLVIYTRQMALPVRITALRHADDMCFTCSSRLPTIYLYIGLGLVHTSCSRCHLAMLPGVESVDVISQCSHRLFRPRGFKYVLVRDGDGVTASDYTDASRPISVIASLCKALDVRRPPIDIDIGISLDCRLNKHQYSLP